MIETPILITEEYWKNSVLSTARFYGHVKAWGHEYVVVNKEGKDIYECTHQANKEGRAQAIPAGQPCDLVDVRYVHIYRKVGRATFIEWVKERLELAEMKKRLKEYEAKAKEKTEEEKKQQLELF